MKIVRFVLLWPALLVLACVSTVRAQSGPQEGGHELQVWTAGGHGLNGITSSYSDWSAGVRYGWVLLGPSGPGLLRGRFEYVVGVAPLFWVFHAGTSAYGVGMNPFGLKWNFATHGRIVPYFEIGGGMLLTNNQVPAGTSRFNFTPDAAVGIHVLGKKYNWSTEVQFVHISNAGLSSANPGINTLQLRIGVGRFTQPRRAEATAPSP